MILDDIVAKTKLRVAEEKAAESIESVKNRALGTHSKLPAFAFENALRGEDIGFICEVKKASPSKGLIAPDFPYEQIAIEYERSGAACISCLTEPYFFQGSDEYLKAIKRRVNIPVIRKDFVIDEYQIYQAKAMDADAVLLICAILDDQQLKDYLALAKSLGLSALVETHDEEEMRRALASGATLIGVNNRNLKDFTVDINNSTRLRAMVPPEITFVAESGIKTGSDIKVLKEAGVNGVLIGETLMRSPEKTKMLGELGGAKVKICGLTRLEDIDAVNYAKPDYIGFVFANTRRKVEDRQAQILRARLMNPIKAVGVFVNEPISHIVQLVKNEIIDLVQIHGDESEDYIECLMDKVDIPVIKGIRVTGKSEISYAMACETDMVLLDAYRQEMYGGTGEEFDHNLIPGNFRKYFLAGGITPENVRGVIKEYHPYCVDVSSGVETNGLKDRDKIIRLVEEVRASYE